ncbi:MAG: hypothetical protein ACYDCO_04210 [Armatimonadota bacterium]
MHSTPRRLPWTIHLIACCYLAPVLILAALSLVGFFGNPLGSLLYSLPIPLLFLGLNLWALYRPNRVNRWIPVATPLLGLVAIALVFTVVAPWAERTATSDAYWIGTVILFFASLVFTVPTLIGALLLLAIPSARRYFFRSP